MTAPSRLRAYAAIAANAPSMTGRALASMCDMSTVSVFASGPSTASIISERVILLAGLASFQLANLAFALR